MNAVESTEHLVLLSIPGLRPRDVSDPDVTPVMSRWAGEGILTEIEPSFPCVTSPVQASMWTGLTPARHGVVANGFYHRDRCDVEFWVARNNVVEGEQFWDALAARSDLTSAVWHAQNIKDAAADYILTPAPIHDPDGTTRLWCYSKPDGLYQELLDDIGHFPLQHYWGPRAGIESTRWIIAAADRLIDRSDPNFHFIYIPHLDYAAQKHGPDSPASTEALRELDRELAVLRDHVEQSPAGKDAVFLLVSEYAMTDVSGVVYPNILLREAGLLTTTEAETGDLIDFVNAGAFAMVDHQCAHVYAQPTGVERAAELFRAQKGIASVLVGDDRAAAGIDHSRTGEIVLVADHDHWFAYYWWLNDADAPAFARTVDIHRKPGYDPVELFFDPKTKSIPLDSTLPKGSHGAPCLQPNQRGAVICSKAAPAVARHNHLRDTDVKSIVLELLGVGQADD